MSINSNISIQKNLFEQMEYDLPICQAPEFESHVHFQDAYKTPVQRWYPYREGYSIELVNYFIAKLGIYGNILDPFSGSGTTLLAARKSNLHSVGVDINPISVLVSKAKNEVYKKNDILALKRFISEISIIEKSSQHIESSYALSDKMFNSEILQALLQFRELVFNARNNKIKNLALMTWLSTIDEVSNVKKEGNGLKYKYRKRTAKGYVDIPKEEWENANFPENKFEFVRSKIMEKLSVCLEDITNSFGPISCKPEIINGDCLHIRSLTDRQFELTFFSPPYCNCFDYFEIHKVELWLGGFVNSQKDIRYLRETGFRSNTNALANKPIVYRNSFLDNLIDLFNIDRLWSKKLPNVVRGYFDDIHTLLEALYHKTVDNGYVGVVIGNSAYSGIIIPSDILIALIAKEVGFKVDNILVARHLTTSSQQKEELEPLKDYLRESIVLLKKA